jgi:ATP-dependent DNA helicase RecQ
MRIPPEDLEEDYSDATPWSARVGEADPRDASQRKSPEGQGPSSAEAAALALERAGQHRSVERSQVEMMRRYAELTDCRRRFLLRYFGEDDGDPCGNCDAGRSGQDVPSAQSQAFPAGGHSRSPGVAACPGVAARRT